MKSSTHFTSLSSLFTIFHGSNFVYLHTTHNFIFSAFANVVSYSVLRRLKSCHKSTQLMLEVNILCEVKQTKITMQFNLHFHFSNCCMFMVLVSVYSYLYAPAT